MNLAHANAEPMLNDGNSNEVTKIIRQCVETIQEEPKLKCVIVQNVQCTL